MQVLTFKLMGLAPRWTADAVSTKFGLESKMRPARDSAENPAKTTEWMAPILAHANCKGTDSAPGSQINAELFPEYNVSVVGMKAMLSRHH